MSDVQTLWAFQAQPATRECKTRQRDHFDAADAYSSDEDVDHPASNNPDAVGMGGVLGGTNLSATATSAAVPHDVSALAEQAEDRRWLLSTNIVARAGSTQHTAELATRQRTLLEAQRAARASHLPWRGQEAEDARVLRVLDGVPPLGSTEDADQLSDWEETLESAKQDRLRFGERDIVQIGRKRTLHEEELSHADDDMQRPSALGMLDSASVLPNMMPVTAAPPPPPPFLDAGASGAGVPPSPWDSMSADMDPGSASWSDASFAQPPSRLGVPTMRHGGARPRTSLPQRWTPQRAPPSGAVAAAAAALDRAANQQSFMAGNLDEDVTDMDTSM